MYSIICYYYFLTGSRLFINASGSGKTRVLLEGLCKYWGLYFVCGSETAYSLGSRDLTTAIQVLNGRSGFLDSPVSTPEVDTNVFIAARSFRAVYAARLVILLDFLTMGGAVGTTVLRMRWVLMQVYASPDIFHDLADELRHFSDDFIRKLIIDLAARIRDIIGHKALFFIVVDEAQSAAVKFPSAFRSRSNNRQAKRPVLSQILRTLNDVHNSLLREYTMIILSGTGIRYDTIKPIVESNVSKPTGVDTVTATGSFGPQDQREYIIKYLFPKKTKISASDETLLRRAWRWLRGRCHYPTLRIRIVVLTSISLRFRFTARFIELILTSACPPKDYGKFLDAYFRAMTGCLPEDDESSGSPWLLDGAQAPNCILSPAAERHLMDSEYGQGTS